MSAQADFYVSLSGDAAEIANNDDRLSGMPWTGAIFRNSHSTSTIAIDYDRQDIIYAWLAAKGIAQRQHKTRPYGPDKQTRTVEDVFTLLDAIAYDAIYQAVENNLRNSSNTDLPLLALLLDNMRNAN